MKLPNKRIVGAILVALATIALVFGLGSAPARAATGSTHHAQAAASTHRTLQYGSVGGEVWLVQAKVGATADDYFGPKTEAAVKAFQKKHHLVVDGIVGPHTWAALDRVPLSLGRLGVTSTAINGAKNMGASVDISQKTHMFYFLRRTSNGKVYVSRTSIVSFAGHNKDGKFTTPSGVFHVLGKGNAKTVSNLWTEDGKPAPMPWYVRINQAGLGFHQDPLAASHGCIHIPSMATAKFVNKHIPYYAIVVIQRR